ncbi:MAG TPA: 30S ribosomal protein S12 methylthiotransferase RimO [Bacteroidales bacterium]|nr:30S ribosomal protein S12 methylthiotransferase RimO [Bacteroidales bacterium]HNS46028.1 30S ribosomal protein S12 methylthiotransferase RimO [Bacteroidales bacterium]
MRTKPEKTLTLITLGCSKNTVDSEKLLKQFRENGFDVSADSGNKNASVVVINTCGFIDDAKEESIDTILYFINEKKKGNVGKVIVMGCLAKRYREELLEEIPEMDGIFGVNETTELLQSLGGNLKYELTGERILTTPSHYAYLKISEGCSHGCSFCAIPLIRGKNVSRHQDDILSEAEYLVKNGTKELILIAQDLTWYGMDLDRRRSLPSLLESMACISGLEWIRLHYTYPAGFPLDLLRVMKQFPNVCNYLDIPIQHISDRVLRSMKRGITAGQTIALLETIRKELPGAAIRTTVIAGYPGETEQEFSELTRFIEQFRFDRLGVFVYSHEEGTPAHRLRDDIPLKVKTQRADEIMHIQEDISYELNVLKLNKTLPVIVDREEGGYFIGRTEFDSPEVDNEVLIEKDQTTAVPGNFYRVLITDVESFDIFGKIVPHPLSVSL